MNYENNKLFRLGGLELINDNEASVDIAIVGGGPAGYVAAIRASQLGATVTLIEERELGGTCLNRGCIPTKALLKTADIAYSLSKYKELGIEVNTSCVNWEIAVNRKNRIVKSLRMGLESLMEKNKINYIKGKAFIKNSNTVIVNNDIENITINSKKIIITTGSEPYIPDIPGINLEGVMSSDQALELKEIPKNIVIIGGGIIGLEFATMFNSVGSKVTIVEMLDRLLPSEDPELSEELFKIMKRQGIKFKFGAKVKEIRKTEGLQVYIDDKGNENIIEGDKILVAVGRKLKSISSDIEALGVTIKNKSICVTENMETNIEGIYAAGDVIGGKLLAHLGFAEGRVAAENALGLNSKIDYDTVPSCIYTMPEVATVGINETEALKRGMAIKTGRFDFRNNGRALCLGDREGYVKIVIEKNTGVIIGGQIIGANASEMISELTLAVSLKVKAEFLMDMIHPHPTLSEAIMEACGDAVGKAIHK